MNENLSSEDWARLEKASENNVFAAILFFVLALYYSDNPERLERVREFLEFQSKQAIQEITEE